MELDTADLTLRTVKTTDVEEVMRMWEWQDGAVSADKAMEAILWMQENHKKNKQGYIHHLCFAVYKKGLNKIIGWCGLDGQCSPGKTVLFYSIHSDYQNKGYATQCAAKLLSYTFNEMGISSINGGCDKNNKASFKVMSKIGMKQNGFEENGDPLFYIDNKQFRSL